MGVFLGRDLSVKSRTRPSLLDRQLGHRCLEYLLTQPAGVFWPDVSDHLEPRRDLLQHLRDELAQPGQTRRIAIAATAEDLRLMHHHLARQMRWQRLATRLPAWPGSTV